MISRRLRFGSAGHRQRSSGVAAGFTLTDLLLAVSLLSFVALAFAALYGTAQSYLTDTISATEAQGGATMAMEHLTRSLRNATAVAFDTAQRRLSITYRPNPSDPNQTRVMRYEQVSAQLRWTPDQANTSDVTTLTDRLAPAPQGFGVTDQDGAPVTASTSAVRVTLNTVVGGRTARLASTVHLRGFGQN